jgi:hypothetical protein
MGLVIAAVLVMVAAHYDKLLYGVSSSLLLTQKSFFLFSFTPNREGRLLQSWVLQGISSASGRQDGAFLTYNSSPLVGDETFHSTVHTLRGKTPSRIDGLDVSILPLFVSMFRYQCFEFVLASQGTGFKENGTQFLCIHPPTR